MYDIYVLNSLLLSMPTSGKKLIYYNTLCQMLHISFIRNVDKLDMVHTYNYWKGLILDLPLKVFNFIVFLKVFNFIVFFFKGKISPFLNLFKLSYSPSHIFRDFKMTPNIYNYLDSHFKISVFKHLYLHLGINEHALNEQDICIVIPPLWYEYTK